MAARSRMARSTVMRLAARVDAAVEAGATVRQACLEVGLPEATYYRRRAERYASAGLPTPERRDVQRARQAIENTAKAVFLRDGYSASLEAIAEQAGVSKKTIYNLYADKETLFRSVILGIHRQLAIVTEIVEHGSIRATLLEFANNYIDAAFDPDIVALSRVIVMDRDLFPDLFRSISELGLEQIRKALQLYLDRLIAEGVIVELDTGVAADAFVGALRGHGRAMMLAGVSQPSPEALAAKARFVVDWFVRGLTRDRKA